MKTVNELNKECGDMEVLLLQLGESKEGIEREQVSVLKAYLKPEDYSNNDAIVSYYYTYLSSLYNIYLDRIESEFEKSKSQHKLDDMKYYNHQRGESKGRRRI